MLSDGIYAYINVYMCVCVYIYPLSAAMIYFLNTVQATISEIHPHSGVSALREASTMSRKLSDGYF